MGIVNVASSNIIVKDEKFLFVKEAKTIALGKYSLPAGKVEFGESLMDCAVREAKEETGLDVKPIKLVGIYQRPISVEDTNTTVFCFLSEVVSGEITTSEQHPEVTFLSLEEIEALAGEKRLRALYMLPAIKDYLQGKLTDLKIITVIR